MHVEWVNMVDIVDSAISGSEEWIQVRWHTRWWQSSLTLLCCLCSVMSVWILSWPFRTWWCRHHLPLGALVVGCGNGAIPWRQEGSEAPINLRLWRGVVAVPCAHVCAPLDRLDHQGSLQGAQGDIPVQAFLYLLLMVNWSQSWFVVGKRPSSVAWPHIFHDRQSVQFACVGCRAGVVSSRLSSGGLVECLGAHGQFVDQLAIGRGPVALSAFPGLAAVAPLCWFLVKSSERLTWSSRNILGWSILVQLGCLDFLVAPGSWATHSWTAWCSWD